MKEKKLQKKERNIICRERRKKNRECWKEENGNAEKRQKKSGYNN